MATFNQKRIFNYYPDSLENIAVDFCEHFQQKGFKTTYQEMISGGYDISISNSNFFKSISGMQTALKIKIQPQDGKIVAEVSVGIWGQQLLPTVISMLFFWPILIFQIQGLAKQAKLDDEALETIESALKQHCRKHDNNVEAEVFCPNCGKGYPAGTKFCSEDGTKLN